MLQAFETRTQYDVVTVGDTVMEAFVAFGDRTAGVARGAGVPLVGNRRGSGGDDGQRRRAARRDRLERRMRRDRRLRARRVHEDRDAAVGEPHGAVT